MEDIGLFLMAFGDFLIYFGLTYLVLTIAVGLLEAWLIHRVSQQLSQDLNEVGQALDEQRLIALTVEQEQDQYLCYNSVTSDFVCQGRDLSEIKERFRARYPNKDAAIYDGDQTAVATLKSQLKELKKSRDSNVGIQ
jgi:hypothetical protein